MFKSCKKKYFHIASFLFFGMAPKKLAIVLVTLMFSFDFSEKQQFFSFIISHTTKVIL